MTAPRIHVLALSGSLRAASANTRLLKIAAELAPVGMSVELYEGLGDLPHFNPDLDGDDPPAAVRRFRERLQVADGVLVCTPEYANGVPGMLKNALDWVVSSGEFYEKPTCTISASPLATGARTAHDSLLLTLGMMTAKRVDGGSLTFPLVNKKLSAEGGLTDDATEAELRRLLEALAAVCGS
ncbi:NAD(P)H-dependent oxidoreductase [Paenibacillus sp. CC-CFT747]|nr:NAD(P)H-dependent oxidoreductase [Paenibacillus sp. CC-CFT747]